jgi:hypothetical protein
MRRIDFTPRSLEQSRPRRHRHLIRALKLSAPILISLAFAALVVAAISPRKPKSPWQTTKGADVDVRRIDLTPRSLEPPRPWHNPHLKGALKLSAPILIPLVFVALAMMPNVPSANAGSGATRLTSFMVPIHQALASAEPLTPAKIFLAGVDTTPPPPPAPIPALAAPVVQAAPAPVAAPAVDTSSAAAWAASPGVACIREHESGDNYSEDTGNGYYGAYQDLLSTWESHGGTGLPSDAPPAVQDQINYEIYQTGGWGQWSTARGCGL